MSMSVCQHEVLAMGPCPTTDPTPRLLATNWSGASQLHTNSNLYHAQRLTTRTHARTHFTQSHTGKRAARQKERDENSARKEA